MSLKNCKHPVWSFFSTQFYVVFDLTAHSTIQYMCAGWFCETSNNSELDIGSKKMNTQPNFVKWVHQQIFLATNICSGHFSFSIISLDLLSCLGKRSQKNTKITAFPDPPSTFTMWTNTNKKLKRPAVWADHSKTQKLYRRERCKKPQGNQVNPTLLAAV